jgi:hypothetical protein
VILEVIFLENFMLGHEWVDKMKMERARVKQDALRAIASPASPYLGWLASNFCICNGEQSSEIPCNKYTYFL